MSTRKTQPQVINRSIIRDICVTIPFRRADWVRAEMGADSVLSQWLEALSGIPFITAEANVTGFYAANFDPESVYNRVSLSNAAGPDNLDYPALIRTCQALIENVWDQWDANAVSGMLSVGPLQRLDLVFEGIPDVMKHTIRDDGYVLLEFDKLCADCRSNIRLEAQAYSYPDAVRFTMTKRDKAQVKD